MAWILTIPCSAFMSGVMYVIAHRVIERIVR
jgi:phosphate/sulfate permease